MINIEDKDYYTSLLANLKDLIKNYAVSITEASNDELYEIYLNHFINLTKLQRKTFNLMNEKGWYNLKSIKQSEIDDKYNLLLKDFECIQDNE